MKFKRNTKYWPAALSALLLASLASSCVNDLPEGGSPADLGEKVRGTLSVPLSASASTLVTRSVDFNPNATLKIDSYWIGVYDTQTKELIGSKLDTRPRKEDRTHHVFSGLSSTFTVEDVDIYYYENHPEAYIVGVINYLGVKAKTAGSTEETTSLQSLLEAADTWDKFCAISVDTQSANTANPNESDGIGKIPLMMGYYTTGTLSAHPTVKGWDNNSVTQGGVKVRFSDGPKGSVALSSGSIKLMRLLSEVTVRVGGPELLEAYATRALGPVPVYPGSGDLQVKVTNLQYKVVNNPTSVYLAEHATDTRGWNINSELEKYAARSANSADYDGEEGYTETGWNWVSGNSFTYQFYENKHWGDVSWFNIEDIIKPAESGDSDPAEPVPDMDDKDIFSSQESVLFIREKKDPEYGYFKSLCLDGNHMWNNHAPYFVIRADVEFIVPEEYGPEGGPKLSGSIEYTVHEGFTSDASGVALDLMSLPWSEPAFVEMSKQLSCDYQRYRNTRYTYNLAITGLEQIAMQAMMRSMDVPDDYVFNKDNAHNDGISGEVHVFNVKKLEGVATEERHESNGLSELVAGDPIAPPVFQAMWNNREDLKWRYLVHSPQGEQNYGNWTFDDNKAAGLPAFWGGNGNCPEELMKSLRILVIDQEGDQTPYPDPSGESFVPGKILYDWTIEDFMTYDGPETADEFYSSEGRYVAFYVPELKTDVSFSQLDEVYRNFYFKVPMLSDGDCSVVNYYFGYEQTPADNRKELPYESIQLQIKDSDHHYWHSYSNQWTTAFHLVNWICWDEPKVEDKQLTADYYILQVGDGEEIIVPTAVYGQGGRIHYPLYISDSMQAGDNTIKIRPMGLTDVQTNSPADYKASKPFEYTDALFVQRNAKWVFDANSVFESALRANNNGNGYYTDIVERYGLTIYGGDKFEIQLNAQNAGQNVGYIQTGGNGGVRSRSFQMVIDRPGTVRVRASRNDNKEPTDVRSVILNKVQADVPVADSKVVTSLSGAPGDYDLKTSAISGPTTVSVYTNGSLRIYSIEFIPD